MQWEPSIGPGWVPGTVEGQGSSAHFRDSRGRCLWVWALSGANSAASNSAPHPILSPTPSGETEGCSRTPGPCTNSGGSSWKLGSSCPPPPRQGPAQMLSGFCSDSTGAPALKARSALKPAEPPTPGWGDVIGSQWDRTLPGVLAGGH